MNRSSYFLALVLWLAAGCSGTEPRQRFLHTLTLSEAIGLINHNGQIAQTLRTTDAAVEVKTPAADSETGADAYVMYARGGKLRLNILALGVGSVMEMCTDGRTMWIHDKDKGVAYRDRVNKLNRITRTAGQFRPEDIASALALEPVELGDPNIVVTLSEEVDWDGQTARAVYALSIDERDYGDNFLVKQFVIDRTTLQMIRQKVYERSGRVVMDVRYEQFLPVAFDQSGPSAEPQEATLILPHRVLIDWPPFGTSIHLTLDEIEVNVPIPPERFDYDQELDPDHPFKKIVPN